MNLQHINIKIDVDGELTVAPENFIVIFHRWVKDSAFDELLIDVADYSHVPDGPGVILIGHEADYSIDHTDGRPGLRYNRKAALDGNNEDRFRQAFQSAARACRLLESQPELNDALRFSRNAFTLSVNDRALAPNTPETFNACKPELESFLKSNLGHDKFSLTHLDDPRRCFAVTIRTDTPIDFPA